jgi:Flp pilus assembly pilin Flp
MTCLYTLIRSPFVRGEEGQSRAEYVLILALIAVLALAAWLLFGDQANKVILSSATRLG